MNELFNVGGHLVALHLICFFQVVKQKYQTQEVVRKNNSNIHTIENNQHLLVFYLKT